MRLPSARVQAPAKPMMDNSKLRAEREAERIVRSRQADWDWAGEWLKAFRESGAKLEDQDAEKQAILRRAAAIRAGRNPYGS